MTIASRRSGAAWHRAALLVSIAALASCSMLQQVAALRRVDFGIDRVSGARLAGVSIERIRNYRDLSALEIAAIGVAVTRGDLPLDFTLHLGALNPSTNTVPARMLQMDWTLLLDDRETVSGRVDREYVFEPGIKSELPLTIRVDLADFFEKNAQDLVDLALAVSGAGGEPKRIALRAIPTIQTSLGPIRYPGPITIVTKTVGGQFPARQQ